MVENTFGIPIIPANEEERLAKLYDYHVLDDFQKAGIFKHIATMAAQIFKAPIALVSFVDRERVFFKGNVGMEETNEAKRGISLCSLAILKEEVTVFEQAKEEPCLLTNPMVTGGFGLEFYAGAPIKTPGGFNIGTVCIIDKKARSFSESDQLLLEGLASVVVEELEERKLFKAT